MKIRKGMRFGAWKVLDSEPYYYEHHVKSTPHIKCVDTVNGVIKLVSKTNLVHGISKGSKESLKKRKKLGLIYYGGHSTRTKHKFLPKNVHFWNEGKKRFRVVSKENGKTKSHGYFYTLHGAKKYAEGL